MANAWTRLEHERLIQRLFFSEANIGTDVRPCGCMRDPLVFGHGKHTVDRRVVMFRVCDGCMAKNARKYHGELCICECTVCQEYNWPRPL